MGSYEASGDAGDLRNQGHETAADVHSSSHPFWFRPPWWKDFFLQSMCNPAEPITRLYKETHHYTRNLHLSGLSWECLWFHTHAVKSANKRQIYCQSMKSIFLVPEVPSLAMILPDSRDCPIFLRDEMTG